MFHNNYYLAKRTFPEYYFEHCHPVCLALHGCCAEMDNLPARQKQLKVAISASTNGDYICSGNAILQHSLARIVDVQVIGMSITYYGKVLVSYYVSW